MIDPRILKSLESSIQDPSYSVIISSFDQPEFCNKDKLEIFLKQYNPNLEEVIENKENIIEELKSLLKENNIDIPDLYELKINSCILKTLSIESLLDYNKKDSLFISGLTGTLNNDIDEGVTSRHVKGEIDGRKVILLENDVPNYFYKTRFRIKGEKFIISIPKKIEALDIKIEEQNSGNSTNSNYTELDIVEGKIEVNIDTSSSYLFDIRYTVKQSLALQNIESIVTPLSSSIEIEFENKYKEIPSIILTIDEDKKVYQSYTTNFSLDENGLYSGVLISLKGLKRQKNYGDINITIIGKKSSD